MSIVRKIQGREALPVWALRYVAHRQESHYSLVQVLAHKGCSLLRHGLVAYRLADDNQIIAYHPEEWHGLLTELEGLIKEEENKGYVDIGCLEAFGGNSFESRKPINQNIFGEEYEKLDIASAEKISNHAFVWLDEFFKWFNKTRLVGLGFWAFKKRIGVHDAQGKRFDLEGQICINPAIPQKIKRHFEGWILMNISPTFPNQLSEGESPTIAHKPPPLIWLSQYQELLELDYDCSGWERLAKEFQAGLRVFDLQGNAFTHYGFDTWSQLDIRYDGVRYCGNKEIPILVGDEIKRLGIQDLQGREKLERLFVKLEDVASYICYKGGRDAPFSWLNIDGKRIEYPKPDKNIKVVYIECRYAKKLLRSRFNESGLEITPEEIAVWLEKGVIRAWANESSSAWPVNYPAWLQRQDRTLDDHLASFYYSERELREVDPPERWLTRNQLLERLKKLLSADGEITEGEISATIENEIIAEIETPKCLSCAMYRLSEIKRYEQASRIIAGKAKERQSGQAASAEPVTLEPENAKPGHVATIPESSPQDASMGRQGDESKSITRSIAADSTNLSAASKSESDIPDSNGEYWADIIIELAGTIEKLNKDNLWIQLSLYEPKGGKSRLERGVSKDDETIIHEWPTDPIRKKSKKLKFGSFRKRYANYFPSKKPKP
ncbi:hypothetical protein [Methylomagnum sp.]